MKKIFQLFAPILLASIFIGCAPTYSIKPIYNKDTKELTVDTLTFQDVRESLNARPIHMGPGQFHNQRANYYIDNEKCTKMYYFYMDAGQRSYITNNLDDDIRSAVRQGKLKNCTSTKISNLKFYSCNNNYRRIGNSYGGSNGGYSMVEGLSLDNTCFYTLKAHFIEQAKKDNIEIIEEKLHHKKNTYTNTYTKYTGQLLMKEPSSKCIQGASISANIENKEITGMLIYNNTYDWVTGSIDDLTFNGQIKKSEAFRKASLHGKFLHDKKTIEGTFLSDDCEGTFKLEKSLN